MRRPRAALHGINGATIIIPNNGPIIVDPIFSRSNELEQRAKELGYTNRSSPQRAPFDWASRFLEWKKLHYARY